MGLHNTLTNLYQITAKTTPRAVGFIIVGAFAGEKVLSGVFDSAWKSNNKGKLYEDLVADGIAKSTA